MVTAGLPIGREVVNEAATGVVRVIEAAEEFLQRWLLLRGECW